MAICQKILPLCLRLRVESHPPLYRMWTSALSWRRFTCASQNHSTDIWNVLEGRKLITLKRRIDVIFGQPDLVVVSLIHAHVQEKINVWLLSCKMIGRIWRFKPAGLILYVGTKINLQSRRICNRKQGFWQDMSHTGWKPVRVYLCFHKVLAY
jgi:hypothetical protein